MNGPIRLLVSLSPCLLVFSCLLATVGVRAQDEEPPAAKPAAKAKPKAAGKAKTAEKGTPMGGIEKPEDPAVLAILAVKPETPPECFRMARTLARLHRPELARPLLNQILARNPDDQQLAAMVEEFGSPAFTELSNDPELQPEAEQLAAAALGAITRRVQDPKRIADLIQQLQDPSEAVRAQAINGLRQGRGAAVAALVAALADPAKADRRGSFRAALAAMRTEAFEPLAGILDSAADLELKIQVMEVLADMKLPGAAIYLLAPALAETSDPKLRDAAAAALKQLLGTMPSRAQAAQWLYERAVNYFRGRFTLKVGADGRAVLWRWDAAQRQCVSESVTVEDACRDMAARLAGDAHALAPGDRQVTPLWLAAMLDEMVYAQGLDRPLDFESPRVREIMEVGVNSIDAVLEFAMAQRHPAAGRAAAEILGRFKQADKLLRRGQEPAALVRAVRSPDRRLRLAALEAIVRLDPDGPYPGSSWVPESLAFLAASRGSRRALVATADPNGLPDLVAALAARHIGADNATFGRETVRMALDSPDYETVLIDAGIGNPAIETTIQELRQDYRTAMLPIGVIARSGFFERAQRVARDDPRTLALVRPHSMDTAEAELNQLAAISPREAMGFQERRQQAARALACLATLANSPRKLYDLSGTEDAVSTGLYAPGLGDRVAAVLADMPSLRSQLALVDLASRHAQPLAVRKAAAKAFRTSTEKHGLLLPEEAIRRQYDRYQRSKDLDLDTQHVLGLLLDAIEARLEASGLGAVSGKKPERLPPGEKPAEKKPEIIAK